MLATLMVGFREGLEAFLVVAIALTYLQRSERRDLVSAAYLSIAASLILCAILGVIFSRIGAWTPIWAGILSLTAAALLLPCVKYMVHMGKRMKRHITENLRETSTRGRWPAFVGVFLFVMLMITREGIEAAVALASFSQQPETQMMLFGSLVGIALAGLVAYLWTRIGYRVNQSKFLLVAAIYLAIFVLQLTVVAFHEFTEANVLPGIDNAFWHLASEPYGPDGDYGMWLSYALASLPLIWLFTFKQPKAAQN